MKRALAVACCAHLRDALELALSEAPVSHKLNLRVMAGLSAECWHGVHIFYGLVALVFVALLFPAALSSALRRNAEGNPAFFYIPR